MNPERTHTGIEFKMPSTSAGSSTFPWSSHCSTITVQVLPDGWNRVAAYHNVGSTLHLSSVFWWLNLVRLQSSYEILYPKRRIESSSILSTIVSPNKILLTCGRIVHGTLPKGLPCCCRCCPSHSPKLGPCKNRMTVMRRVRLANV